MPDNYEVRHGCWDCDFREWKMDVCGHPEAEKYHKPISLHGICDRHPLMAIAKSCKWAEDADGIWETACCHSYEFIDDGPAENGAKFCPYCGSKIVARKYQEKDDE